MEKLEMVQIALQELGDVHAEAITAFVEQRFQTRVESKFIPLFKASIRERARAETLRQAARAAAIQSPPT